jgi:hypothetical protein
MKKVLIVSYFFPPVNLPGSYRAAKFVKYLRQFGWEPIVLTARRGDAGGRPLDYALLDDIPEATTIIRTHSIEPLRLFVTLTKPFRKTIDLQATVNEGDGQQNTRAPLSPRHLARGLLRLLTKYLFSLPDPYVGWVPFAAVAAVQAFRRQKPNVVFTSSPPLSSHLVGLVLKAVFGVPWVADFRDPWLSLFREKKSLAEKAESYLGRQVLKKADKIISVSDEMNEKFTRSYPLICSDKYDLITNGYDPDDYTGIMPYRFDKFTILHTGEVFKRDPSPVLESVKRLAASEKIGKDFQLVFLGSLYKKPIRADDATRDMIKVWEPVPHRNAVGYMLGADVLLLLMGETADYTIGYSSKFFEYLFANKPILAIAPDGPIPGLVESANLGFCYKPTDGESIGEGIMWLYSRWKEGRRFADRGRDILRRFHRKTLAEKLARLLNEVSP